MKAGVCVQTCVFCQAKISVTAGIDAQQLYIVYFSIKFILFLFRNLFRFFAIVLPCGFLGRSESGHGATNC